MNENKTNINCDKTIYINIHSNHWKYWNYYVEIFTCFDYKHKGDYEIG